MIDRLNRMNTQTAAFLLLLISAVFVVVSLIALLELRSEMAVFVAVFGLANNCTGGALIMLRAAGKEVVTNNQPGSSVAQQTVAPDASAQVPS